MSRVKSKPRRRLSLRKRLALFDRTMKRIDQLPPIKPAVPGESRGWTRDDLERAERFYTEVLGMKVEARIQEEGARLSRLKCGDADVVLFKRPRPLGRNSLKEDGITHQAFEVPPDTFDEAIEFLKSQGYYHDGPVVRPSGRAVYFFDSEGNYQQLHASK